jgi:hypothetical protein
MMNFNLWFRNFPAVLFLVMGCGQAVSVGDTVSFTREIRPILAAKCLACHGMDEASRKAKLRLDEREAAIAEREGSSAIVPGDPEASTVLARILSHDPDEVMPPPASGERLSAEEVGLIRRWIAEGAVYERHWAFDKPVRPPLPAGAREGAHPVDAFILYRLGKEGLAASGPAPAHVLARRVSLDLTGLPPPPALLTSFLRDPSEAGYTQYVDALLALPSFGERWASMWLDLARYSDTKGYEKDQHREIWRFRDWLIDALNADMPYDQFTREVLAGDLLPNATPEQMLATAFHRNTMSNDEGGTDDEEFRTLAVKDRVDTTMKTWMGLTMDCAQCHTHKYDPIPISEYYSFYAIFNQTEDSDKSDDRPTMEMPTAHQRAEMESLRARHDKLVAERDALEKQAASPEVVEAWIQDLFISPWRVAPIASATAASGVTITPLEDGSWLVGKGEPASETYTLHWTASEGSPITALALEALPDPSHPKSGVGRSSNDGNFVLTGIELTRIAADGTETAIPLSAAKADYEQKDYPVAHAIKSPDPKKKGWAVSPKLTEAHRAVFRLATPLKTQSGDTLRLVLRHTFAFSYPGFSIGRFRVTETSDAEPFRAAEISGRLWAAARTEGGTRHSGDAEALLEAFAQRSEDYRKLSDMIAALDKDIGKIKGPSIPIMRELPADKQRLTHIHERGDFLSKGTVVQPGVPTAFHPLPEGAPANRLGAAEWLMHPDNPLTARVAVNRIWARLFGRGIVETEEDFGTQGFLPTHPELLDWLAVEYREKGWSLKELCRLLVTSNTYRQDSRVTPELLERDPRNLWLARAPRFRMDAEMIRDATLHAAGILDPTMHGPSVMPLQPEGIWRSTYNARKWVTSAGGDARRRALYTYHKRTSPYPSAITFDATSREVCTIRRFPTNTPLQALVTLNDPAYLEAARALAAEAWGRSEGRLAEAIQHAWERVLIRTPTSPNEPALSLCSRSDSPIIEGSPPRPRCLPPCRKAIRWSPSGRR